MNKVNFMNLNLSGSVLGWNLGVRSRQSVPGKWRGLLFFTMIANIPALNCGAVGPNTRIVHIIKNI